MMARSQQELERRGELNGGDGVVDCSQYLHEEAAGAATGRREARSWTNASFPWKIDQIEGVGECVRERGEDWEREEGCSPRARFLTRNHRGGRPGGGLRQRF
jgi:hypothetical protein